MTAAPEPMTQVECALPGRDPVLHTCSPALTDAEILARFGLRSSRYRVRVWPVGAPEEARVIHRGDQP